MALVRGSLGCYCCDERCYEIAGPDPRCRCEPFVSPSRRDRPIVAWHEVPGKASSKEPSRRVRYDRRAANPLTNPLNISRRNVYLGSLGGQVFFLKGSCPMLFGLLLNGMDRFPKLRDPEMETV